MKGGEKEREREREGGMKAGVMRMKTGGGDSREMLEEHLQCRSQLSSEA